MIIDVTGTVLIPGNQGKECPGNGEDAYIECCCDECDYMLCCFDMQQTTVLRVDEPNRSTLPYQSLLSVKGRGEKLRVNNCCDRAVGGDAYIAPVGKKEKVGSAE